MDRIDWSEIDEKELDAFHRRLALVETIIDGSIEETERRQVRHGYLREHGVSERTIRNYLKRYQDYGAEGLVFHRRGSRPRSPRIHDEALRAKILSLIEELPGRTVPQLRRLLTGDPEHRDAIERVSDRTIYRFLNEQGLSRKQRSAKATDGARR